MGGEGAVNCWSCVLEYREESGVPGQVLDGPSRKEGRACGYRCRPVVDVMVRF